MIIDIPAEEDFRTAGKDFLCLGWESVCGLSFVIEEGLENFSDDEAEEGITDAYWNSAQRPLSTALSLVEQGVEFLLKGRIASVSPFLLIANEVNGWPKPNKEIPIRFSEFKTLDAKDLIKVYNTVAPISLTDEFRLLFDRLRTKRNTIMHTVDPELRIRAEDVMVDILEIHLNLLSDERWIDIRESHINNSPDSVAFLYPDENNGATLIREIMHAIEGLSPNLVKRYFGINKKQRRYYCPDCYVSYADYIPNGFPFTALLQTVKADSAAVKCLICEKLFNVKRERCAHPSCKGNVIYMNDGTCLTCFRDQV